MKFQINNKYILFGIIIILNAVLRFPTTPHEIGCDSFAVHGLANSITQYGHAEWWLSPSSIFGYYPLSYPSAVPFFLSSISQSTGLNMEYIIFIVAVGIGILSAFFAYLMAGEFLDDELFKFIVALVYSTAPKMLYFTTWTISTRGSFMVLLPLFIFAMLRCRKSLSKYLPLCVLLFIILMTTHRMFILLLILIFVYAIVLAACKIQIIKNVSNSLITSIALLMVSGLLFLLPLYGPSPIMKYYLLTYMDTQQSLTYVATSYGSAIGLMVFFAAIGFIYLIFKKDKTKEMWFVVLSLLSFIPLLSVMIYVSVFTLPIMTSLAGFGIILMLNFLQRKTNKKAKTGVAVIMAIIIFSICFSALLQVWHPNVHKEVRYGTWHMNEYEFNTGVVVKEYRTSGTIFTNDMLLSDRVAAISGAPCLAWRGGPMGLVYGFFNEKELKMQSAPWYKKTIYETNVWPGWPWYYLHELYIDASSTREIMDIHPSTYGARQIIDRFNITYAIENNEFYGKYGYVRPSKFFQSMHETESKVFDNGKVSVWAIKRA